MSFGDIISGIGSGVNIAGSIADLFRKDSSGGGGLIPPDPYKGLISTDAYRFGSGALAGTGDMAQQERRLLGLSEGLGASASPGFGQLTTTGVDAIRRNAQQASGNLRSSLAQRGLSGASFANDQVGRVLSDYQTQENEFRAQAFQAEYEASLKAITQQQQILAQQAERELGELGIATAFLAQVNQTILSQAQAQQAAASQNIIANLPPLQGGAGGTTPVPGTGGGGTGGTGGAGGTGTPGTAAVRPPSSRPSSPNSGPDPRGGEGGRERDPRVNKGGYAPGYSPTAGIIGSLMGLAIPGAGTLIGAGNALAGTTAAQQQADLMSQITGQPINLGLSDLLNAGLGGGPFGAFSDSPYSKGLGGYGELGIGGYTGMQNMLDPGVAGAARAQAASVVAANQPGLAPTTATTGPKTPTPSTASINSAREKAVAAARAAATKGMIKDNTAEERKAAAAAANAAAARATAAFNNSLSHLQQAGTLSASSLSQAGQLAQSGRNLQQGKSGVSGSQIGGGRTVGNNPNDRSGRNPGASRDAGAGGRLGGGV
jgi:hypothetical protein